MKVNKIFSALMLIAAVAFTACDSTVPDGPSKKPNTDTTITTPPTEIPDIDIPAEAITVAEARAICAALEDGAQTDEKYYVKGWIKKLANKHADGITSHGNALFYMVDQLTDQDDFYAYQVYGKNGEKLTSLDQVAVNDYVVVYGPLTNFGGTYETVGKGAAYIYSSSNPNFSTTTIPTDLVGDGSEQNPFTVADVITLNNTKTGNWYAKGVIVGQINGMNFDNAEYETFTPNDKGTATNILIAAAAGERDKANIVAVQLPSGGLRNGLNLIANPTMLNQEVIIYGSLEAYFGQPGIKSPTYAKVGDTEFGTKPAVITGDELINETLLTEASYNKFTAISVKGEQVWSHSTSYGATMSGFANSVSNENEDWFISPAFDATGKTPVLSFDHARGPAGSMSVAVEGHYTVWVSNDFNGTDAAAISSATWTELTGIEHGTSAWGYVNSGAIAIPAANCGANCRIAFKYVCDTKESATWEIKNVIVK